MGKLLLTAAAAAAAADRPDMMMIIMNKMIMIMPADERYTTRDIIVHTYLLPKAFFLKSLWLVCCYKFNQRVCRNLRPDFRSLSNLEY